MNSILRIGLPAALIVLLLSLWELSVTKGVVNTALFPAPTEIFSDMLRIPHLGAHLSESVRLLLVSVAVGFSLGFVAGIAMSRFRLNWIEDVVSFFMAIPGISWAPLFIITIGFGFRTIFIVGVITAFFPAVYNVFHGMRDIDQNLKRLGSLLEFSPFEMFYRVQLPSIMNYALTGLKLSVARTWRTIIAVEMIAASTFGLGYMIFDARELLNMEHMFAGILLSGFIYMLIEFLGIRFIEIYTVERWGMKAQS
jgi:NitT/TauT family transport system permease protein